MTNNTRATIRLLTPHNKTLVNSEFAPAHLPSTLSKDELTALFFAQRYSTLNRTLGFLTYNMDKRNTCQKPLIG